MMNTNTNVTTEVKVKKPTKRDYFNDIRAIVTEYAPDRSDLVDFIDKSVEQLAKKSIKTGESKTAQANAPIKAEIIRALTEQGKGMTITELQNAYPDTLYNGGAISNQKISALMTQLIKSGEVTKMLNKKKAYFSVV